MSNTITIELNDEVKNPGFLDEYVGYIGIALSSSGLSTDLTEILMSLWFRSKNGETFMKIFKTKNGVQKALFEIDEFISEQSKRYDSEFSRVGTIELTFS